MASRLSERAHQDREIVYFLQQPETHAFALYHDYHRVPAGHRRVLQRRTRWQPRVEPGGAAARHGRVAEVETLNGRELLAAKVDVGEPIGPEAEVVVIRFPAYRRASRRASESARPTRTQAATTRTAKSSSGIGALDGRAMRWCCRPAGTLTASCIPAVVTMTDDGAWRLDLEQPEDDEIAVLLKGRGGRRGSQ